MGNVNIQFDDERVYKRLKQLKQEEGYTWKGILLQGEKRIREDKYDPEVTPTPDERMYLKALAEGHISPAKIADYAEKEQEKIDYEVSKNHKPRTVKDQLEYLRKATEYVKLNDVGYELTAKGEELFG